MREADTVVKQHLKKAKVNLLHKLSRQAGKLEKKRGSSEQLQKKERKLERLHQLISQAKDVDLDDLARVAVVEGPASNRVAELKAVLCLPLDCARLRRELLLSVQVQNAVLRVKRREEGGSKPTPQEKKVKTEEKPTEKPKENPKEKPEENPKEKPEENPKEKPEENPKENLKENLKEKKAENVSNGGAPKANLPKPPQLEEDMSDGDDAGDDDDEDDEDDEVQQEEDDQEEEEKIEYSSDESDCAISLGSGFCDLGGGGGGAAGGAKAAASTGRRKVKELHAGGDSDSDEDDVRTKRRAQKKNRLGQRARQKKWEEQFGKQARHVVENRPANKPRVFKKKQRVGEQDGGRRGKGAPPGGKHTAAHKPVEEDLSDLHPSWAAKRLSKERSATIKSFEGKRMTFSDSD